MLPKQGWGTFKKHITKPSEQVAAPGCMLHKNVSSTKRTEKDDLTTVLPIGRNVGRNVDSYGGKFGKEVRSMDRNAPIRSWKLEKCRCEMWWKVRVFRDILSKWCISTILLNRRIMLKVAMENEEKIKWWSHGHDTLTYTKSWRQRRIHKLGAVRFCCTFSAIFTMLNSKSKLHHDWWT